MKNPYAENLFKTRKQFFFSGLAVVILFLFTVLIAFVPSRHFVYPTALMTIALIVFGCLAVKSIYLELKNLNWMVDHALDNQIQQQSQDQ